MTKTQKRRQRDRVSRLALCYAYAMEGFLERHAQLHDYRQVLCAIATLAESTREGQLARKVLAKWLDDPDGVTVSKEP